jgi:heme/copper-type cytochrome/quinol oxidase subunit 2
MEYLYFTVVMAFAIYMLLGFKKEPNDTTTNLYYNSRFYRVLILIICVVIAIFISFFVKQK